MARVAGWALVTTNASWPELSLYSPPALQVPAGEHDTELTTARWLWLRAAVPGTSLALPQVPCTWLTTNACECRPELSV